MDRHAHSFGAYCITPLPGQPQVAVTHAFFVYPSARGDGHGKAMKAAQMSVLSENAFDYGICTVRADNDPQKAILKASGWRHLDTFYSSAQDTDIQIWGCTVDNQRRAA